MRRPRISGQGKQRKKFQRIAVDYSYKLEVLNYLEEGYNLNETIAHFNGEVSDTNIQAKKKQINKWLKQTNTIRDACENGRGRHRNLRNLGEATVLPSDAEKELVLWVNSLRTDGAPVSRLMLQLQPKEVASDCDKFAASSTWIKLFLRQHWLSLRARTRQGQTTPDDAQEAAKRFVLLYDVRLSRSIWNREIRALQTQTESEIYENRCAWWNSDLSMKFLEFHFANRPNRHENILLLWDNFSGHWTPKVVRYAETINVVLVKIPPRYTYVCRLADVSLNKLFKAGLRAHWIQCLREQLVEYCAGSQKREEKRIQLQKSIFNARKGLTQEDADVEVAKLHEKNPEEKFLLKPPSRSTIVRWVSQCWGDLSNETITSGFSKVGILMDTRPVVEDPNIEQIESSIIEELKDCNLAGDDVASDDDIGSGEEFNNESEGDV